MHEVKLATQGILNMLDWFYYWWYPLGSTPHGNHLLQVWIPSVDREQYELEAEDCQSFEDAVAEIASLIGGGYTITDGDGGWWDDEEGVFHQESVRIVSTFFRWKNFRKYQFGLRRVLLEQGQLTNQAAVAFSIDGQFFTLDIRS